MNREIFCGDDKFIKGKKDDKKHEGKASEERRKQAADFDLKEAKEEIVYQRPAEKDEP